MDQGKSYEVRDMGLADQGRRNIEIAELNMAALGEIRRRFEKDKPLAGVRIGLALHVTKETAEVAITGCNPLSTQDDVAAALAAEGVHVWGYKGENREDYYRYIKYVIAT